MNKNQIILSMLLLISLVFNIFLNISSMRKITLVVKKIQIQYQNTTSNMTKELSILKDINYSSSKNTKTTIKENKTLSSVNNFDYSYLINTKINYCGKGNGKDLLFIAFVPVSPNSFEKRDLIRSTWAYNKYLKSKD